MLLEAEIPASEGAPSPRTLTDVVILNDFAHVQGGGSQVAVVSATALAERGLRVLFLAAAGPVAPELMAAGVRVVCLAQADLLGHANPLRAAAQALWNRPAAAALAAELKRLDPARTAVHLHGWGKALSGSVVRTALDAGFRVVSTLHDYTAVCPNGGFYDYRRERVCTLKPLSLACIARDCDSRRYAHKLWRVARHAVQSGPGRLTRGIRHFVAVSETDRALHVPHLPAGARLHLIENPIAVKRAPSVRPQEGRRFVAVGRLAAEKGIRLFACAARDAGVEALFVGDGYLRDDVRRIHPAAEVTGWLGAAEVSRHLAACRALVFASQWPETQGLAVLEAAAIGVPAIVSDICGAREWVEDGVTGLVFRSGDRADLVRRITELADDRLVARLGRNAYERFWADPPTPARHANSLLRLYGDVLVEAGR